MGHRLYSCPVGPDPAPPRVAAPVAEPAGHGQQQHQKQHRAPHGRLRGLVLAPLDAIIFVLAIWLMV